MNINAQFNNRVVVHAMQSPWLESPMKGVFRRPLDRVGSEVARATSIVKYMPNSKFSSHTHTGGEEFVVLQGTFQDEHGDYPAGTYVRNPPTSSHTPGSKSGCVIFVKLWQFHTDDRNHVRINTDSVQAIPDQNTKKVLVIPLHKDQYEDVRIEYWEPNSQIQISADTGLEILVLNGSFIESGDHLTKQSWIRLPKYQSIDAITGPEGAKVWVKRNHLNNVDEQIQRVHKVS